MRKRLAILLLVGMFAFPFSTRAQETLKLTTLQVQLWPEYDQPSMLVIYDFKVPDDTKLPVNVSLDIPYDANLTAVALLTDDGRQVNTDFTGPAEGPDWKVVTIQIQKNTTYHIEYYEPITKSGGRRDFTYVWSGGYPVDDLSVSVRVPVDTNNIVTNPIMKSSQNAEGADILIKDFGPWQAGVQFMMQVNYTKTSDNLTVSQQSLQPSQPIGSNTQGRLILSNYLPYVFGILGLSLFVGGGIFLWQSSRSVKSSGRKRIRSHGGNEPDSGIYCSQCGARARTGDRFCRVCGTKLRLAE